MTEQTKKSKPITKRTMSVIIPLVLLSMTIPGIMNRFILIETRSVSERFCFTKPMTQNSRIEKGDIVFFRDPKVAGCKLIAKYASGIPGSIINVMKDKIAIDHKVEIKSFVPSKKRIPIGLFQLKEDEYFLTGKHPKSWDSRYIGSVKRDQIEHIGMACF
jgi:type IV secretory pathway protease TraF